MAPLRRFFVAAAFGLALAAGAADPVAIEDPGVAAGVRFVESGDLERAIATLEAALTRLPGERTSARAAAHLYLGMAHIGLEHGSMARLHLREAWVLRAGEALDPRRFPPRVIELYEENRPARPLRPEPTPLQTPRPTPKPSGPLPFALGAAAGAGVVGLVTLGGDTEVPARSGSPTVRAFNCDDGCRVWLNGDLLAEVAMGQDSGRIEIAGRLAAGASNVVAFEVTNAHGGVSYGFEVRVGEAIVFQEVCGVAARLGCEDDKPFPPGVARRYEYVLP
jgi:hypothetical protein